MTVSIIYEERLSHYENWAKEADRIHRARLDKRYVETPFFPRLSLRNESPQPRNHALQIGFLVLVLMSLS